MGTIFLVLKSEKEMPESPFERLELRGAVLSRVLCPLLPDTGGDNRLGSSGLGKGDEYNNPLAGGTIRRSNTYS